MNAGRSYLVEHATDPVKPKVNAFSVGTASGFTPDPNGTGVTPSSIYEGAQNFIYKTIVNPNELILSAVFPNSLELSSIGNIMLKLNDTIPFIWFSLAKPFAKKSIDNVKHFGGDLQFQSMVLKIPAIVSRLNLLDNPDFYATARRFDNTVNMPRPVDAGASEFITDSDNAMYNLNRPVYGTRIKNAWWGVPGLKSFDDPNYDVLDGGEVGTGYGV